MDHPLTLASSGEAAPSADGLLPAGVTFIAATRRLAYHLRARHDEACLARGLNLWATPDVVTWQELLRRQFDADRARGVSDLRWLDPAHAVLAWGQVVRQDAELGDVLAPAGLGSRAQRAWQRLHDYRIPREALQEDSSPEVRAFGRWLDAYERWLRRGGWLDAAEASAVVGPGPAASRLCFVGFDRLTPAQEAAVARFVAAGVVVTHAHESVGDETASPVLVACDDFDDELQTAARWAASRLRERPDDRLALIVPNLARERDRVHRALDRVLVPPSALTGGPDPEATAYELAAARALSERPVVVAALAWLEAAVGDPDLASLGALLRNAFDAAAQVEAAARAEFDAWLRRHEPDTRGLARLTRHATRQADCPATVAQLERVVVRARGWHAAQLPSRWVPEFFALLQDAGWPGVAPDSAEQQALQRWHALLERFAACDDVLGPVRAASAVGHLRALAGDASFEPQEIAAALLVIDPETALGMRFDAAWVCGLDATRWPAPAAPDPFLPRDWQVRQGVPGVTAEFAEREARRVLERLRGAVRGALICSVPRFEADAPLLPSALVADLEPVDSVEQWQGPTATQDGYERRPVLESTVDGALPALTLHEVARGGARMVELQAQCPFRAATELRLGARALEDPVTGVAATERGTFVHAVLQRVWQELRTHARLAAMPADELSQWVARLAHAQVEPLLAEADPVRRRLLAFEQRWIEMRVLELLARDLERAPFEVVEVESATTIEVGGVQVRLKLDRVDRLADGSLAVIDYKTGANAKPEAWMGERPDLPQLPLYVRAAGEDAVGAVAFGVVRRGATQYLGFARDGTTFTQLTTFDPGKRPFKDYPSWYDLLQAWRRRLDAVAHEHAQGDARLAPDPRKACRHCHLPALCRIAQATAEVGEGVTHDDV